MTETILLETLPEYENVRWYPEADIIAIGCLTTKTRMTEEALLRAFRRLMKKLGFANRAFANRLHWACRIGGKPKHLHIHFLIGKTQLVDGHRHSYTPEQVCEFIRKEWALGMNQVDVFVPGGGGVSYTLRREEGECEAVEISDGMTTAIKRIRREKEQQEGGL